MHTNDPLETIIADGLGRAGIRFVHWSDNKSQALDFSLPDFGIYVECKQFATDKTSAQIAPFPNVIVIQGREAAQAFARLIAPDGLVAAFRRYAHGLHGRWPWIVK
jgi:hypothetical protein